MPPPAIAYYRRREAASPEEKECIENLFDCLCSCLLLPENQARFRQVGREGGREGAIEEVRRMYPLLNQLFTSYFSPSLSLLSSCIQSEGLDLLLRCIRERKGGFLGALKALDSACLNSVRLFLPPSLPPYLLPSSTSSLHRLLVLSPSPFFNGVASPLSHIHHPPSLPPSSRCPTARS